MTKRQGGCRAYVTQEALLFLRHERSNNEVGVLKGAVQHPFPLPIPLGMAPDGRVESVPSLQSTEHSAQDSAR